MAENKYRQRDLPPVPQGNERKDPTSNVTFPEENLYEEVNKFRGENNEPWACRRSYPSQRSAQSGDSSKSENFSASEYEYVNQTRRNVPRSQGNRNDYLQETTNDTTKKIQDFKANPSDYLAIFERTSDEMLADEETFIILFLLKKDTKLSVLESRLDQLAMLACCKSPRVVKRALDALLNEIFLSISVFPRIRCDNVVKAEEIIRDSFPKFLKSDHFKARCHRMTTYAWLITLVLLKCSKEELEEIQPKLKEFDKTLNSLQNDKEKSERNLFRYGIYIARESIKRIILSCGKRDSSESLAQSIKKCENILNSNLETNEVMKFGNELRNAGSWLDLHVCIIFLQDLPKFFQFRGSRKPIILIQLLIADYRNYCRSKKGKLSRMSKYKWQFEMLVYRVMLRLIRTSTDHAIIDQVLHGIQGCGGALRSWIQNKTEALDDELVLTYLEKVCQKALFYAKTPSTFQPFLTDRCEGDGTGFMENLSISWLSSAYKDRVLEIFPESRVPLGEYRVVSYDASMSGKKCLMKLYQNSREDVLGSKVLIAVSLQEEIKILKILNDVEEPCPNIVQLIASSDEIPMHMIIERAPRGDLLTHLQSIERSPEAQELLKIARDICAAMTYLGDYNIIHRDLRAKNCFIFMEDERVRLTKLGDFRLAIWYHPPKLPKRQDDRQSCVKSRVNEELPKEFAVRWTSVEALRFKEFSPASDVWSFGVLLSEIFTLGCLPYMNMPSGISLESDEKVREFVCDGKRLELHPKIPESIQNLIELTMIEKDRRPTFSTLKDILMEVDFKDDLYQAPAYFKMLHRITSHTILPPANLSTDCSVPGCFGKCLNATDIATPLYDDGGSPVHRIKEFIDALNISSDTLKLLDLNHPSLVHITEKIMHAERMEVITEVGDLGNFEKFSLMFGCPVKNAVRYTSQIADALLFLHNRSFIHRNLRATSVFVYSSGNAKLACFARMRQLKPNPEEYSCTIPVTLTMPEDSLRWSSPEVVSRGEYSKASDIWAFAVMTWEMFTLTEKGSDDGDDETSHHPYHPLETKEQILSYLEKERLNKPRGCPDWLYDMMLICWKYNAKDRLKCQDIVECIMKQKSSTADDKDDILCYE